MKCTSLKINRKLDWDESEEAKISVKVLKTVVLKHMFTLDEIEVTIVNRKIQAKYLKSSKM